MTEIDSAKPLRIGILGAARIAPRAIIKPAGARDDVVIACVAARDPARARAFAAEHGIAAVAEDYAALIARDDLDLVYVALPPAGHAEWSIRAMEAGKAVLCKKPFAMNAAEARRMIAASERTGRALVEAFHYRFHAVLLRAFELAASGALGPLIHAEAHFAAPIPWREGELRWLAAQGGGALMDLGCYCVHSLRTLGGAQPDIVSAEAKMKRGVDARMRAKLAFPNGLTADLSADMSALAPNVRLKVRGACGAFDLINFVAPQLGCKFSVEIDGKKQSLPTGGAPTFAAQLDHVVQVMRGETPPLTGGADAAANMETIDAIYARAGVRTPM